MKISELITELQKQQDLCGDYEIKVRTHHSGVRYSIDYITYWTKEKEYHIGIERNVEPSRSYK
ncbi:hypothetical protein [Dysgonomonas gadei]|uniref:Uncharacterized protein n=1 Tax=Dysgonomonas gadei ATCC BAA-286 TaxID=742766 RepID=F5IV99_9BACT|nr:hypothetical protein [Dysgonomonas gadei]EGK02549.1 hypothetical protein HMPREF9455_00799 [Dysgonomonas gadei ATCC BAA-286]